MPLLVSSPAQNSAYSSKSRYDCLVTRLLAPLVVDWSAWIAPSAARQLAPPVTMKLPMPEAPSISVTHPAPPGPLAQPDNTNAANTANTAAIPANNRFIALLLL